MRLVIALAVWLLPGLAYAACPEIPPISRVPTTGSPFATGNKGVTLMETQTSDAVRVTGGCLNLVGLSGGALTLSSNNVVPLTSTGEIDTNQNFGTLVKVPYLGALYSGTAASPVTTAGSPLQISLEHAILKSSCADNAASSGCASGLNVYAHGQSTATMSTTGITSSAISDGPANADAMGIVTHGRIYTGSGLAIGLFTDGRRYVNTAQAAGIQLRISNMTTSNCTAGTHDHQALSDCDGLFVHGHSVAADGSTSGAGGYTNGVAVHIAAGSNEIPDGGKFREGVSFNADTVTDYTFRDTGSGSTTVFYASGTHTYGLALGPQILYNGIGTVSPLARLHFGTQGGTFSAPAWTADGIAIRQDALEYIDTSSAGAVGNNHVNGIAVPTISSSSAVTYATAATLYIAGAPVAGTNTTITDAVALRTSGGLKFSALPTGAGAGGLYLCVDNNGLVYKKAACP